MEIMRNIARNVKNTSTEGVIIWRKWSSGAIAEIVNESEYRDERP
jgi:hypothetical protein